VRSPWNNRRLPLSSKPARKAAARRWWSRTAKNPSSADKEQEYFADGLSEELLNLLARIPELRVISRSSAFSFKGKDLEIPEIARRLNVAHILEGSVRKAGNRVRITAQLIEARSDTHLWSETYDRTLDDVFAIQDEIATTVVEQLRMKLLGPIPRVRETAPEAYTLYLQARYLGRLHTAEAYRQSNDLYQQALAIDADYAAAWDGLARNYFNMKGIGLLRDEDGSDLARKAAEKALAIDPDYAQAHTSLAWVATYFDNDLRAAARHLERALALDPTDLYILDAAATLLFNLGRLDQSIAVNEYVNTRDPLNPNSHWNLCIGYQSVGRWQASIVSAKTTLRLSPGTAGAQYLIGDRSAVPGRGQCRPGGHAARGIGGFPADRPVDGLSRAGGRARIGCGAGGADRQVREGMGFQNRQCNGLPQRSRPRLRVAGQSCGIQ
jgi:TolB-like protein